MPTYEFKCPKGHVFERFYPTITNTRRLKCPKCGKATRIVKRVKDRERGVPGGVFISCSGCDFFEKL